MHVVGRAQEDVWSWAWSGAICSLQFDVSHRGQVGLHLHLHLFPALSAAPAGRPSETCAMLSHGAHSLHASGACNIFHVALDGPPATIWPFRVCRGISPPHRSYLSCSIALLSPLLLGPSSAVPFCRRLASFCRSSPCFFLAVLFFFCAASGRCVWTCCCFWAFCRIARSRAS